jgi:hypothetical protein
MDVQIDAIKSTTIKVFEAVRTSYLISCQSLQQEDAEISVRS